jgi:SAM-dependent methyltransferase
MSATSESRATVSALAATPACMLCGGTHWVPHFGGGVEPPVGAAATTPYRITHSERRLVHTIARCTDCGLVTLPFPEAGPTAYDEAADPYYVEQAAQRIANAHRLLAMIPAGGRLLELGCACGFLLVAARERGFDVHGIEMSAWAAAYARQTYGLDVRTGSLEEANLPAASHDVVVMADVIEHLTDPPATLRAIHRILRPGGRLLLLTPDIGSAMARLCGTRWWSLLDDHYFYFSRRTLARLLDGEGFAVERISALGRVFPVGHWVFKLALYSPTVQRAAARATRALGLDALQISINFGDQMACVARRN